LTGAVDIDLHSDALGTAAHGKLVHLSDIWPSPDDVAEVMQVTLTRTLFAKNYEVVFAGDAMWQKIKFSQSERYRWDPQSTYIANPPFFAGMTLDVPPITAIEGARCL